MTKVKITQDKSWLLSTDQRVEYLVEFPKVAFTRAIEGNYVQGIRSEFRQLHIVFFDVLNMGKDFCLNVSSYSFTVFVMLIVWIHMFIYKGSWSSHHISCKVIMSPLNTGASEIMSS